MEPPLNDALFLQQSVSPGRNNAIQNVSSRSSRHLRKQLSYTSHDKDVTASTSTSSLLNTVQCPSRMYFNQTNNSNDNNNYTPLHANYSRPSRHRNSQFLTILPALIFLLLSSFHIHSSSSSEITSFQQNGGIGAESTGTNNNNNFNSNNNILSNNGIYSHTDNNNDDHDNPASIDTGPSSSTTSDLSFSSSSFQQSPAAVGSSSISSTSPSSSSESIHNQFQAAPTSSVFVNGLENDIRKINSTAFLQLTTDAPFQLQFRTACKFGNIVYDDNIIISINSEGLIAYSYDRARPNFQGRLYNNVVSDKQWHTITFEDTTIRFSNNGPSIQWKDVNSTSAEKVDHYFNFFDGFVGCIRIPMSEHESHDRSSDFNNDNEESENNFYENPQSPSDHRLLSLMRLFGLTNRHTDPRCEHAFDEIVESHACFEPDSFVLCEKCTNKNSSGVCEANPEEGNNFCSCPEETGSETRNGKYCNEPQLVGVFVGENSTESSNETMTTTTTRTTSNVTEIRSFPWKSEDGPCPCKNGGDCKNASNDQIYCECVGLWKGMYCLEPLPPVCQREENKNICNNGRCFDTDEGLGYECFCRPGFAGRFCEKNIQECLSSPCLNGGKCLDGIDDYTCDCSFTGFNGTNCEVEIDECESNPCENGATCDNLIADYRCNCTLGFEDKNCSTNINDCQPNPCENGGKCNDGINSYTCDCEGTGFFGETCEINVDDCVESDCQNGATCVDLVNGFNCTCHGGYEGDKCQIDIDECASNPCLNGGSCYQRSNESLYNLPSDDPLAQHFIDFGYDRAEGFVCVCALGFDGDMCENNIDDCVEKNGEPPCDKGKCVDGVNSYECACFPGYEGERCELEINECDGDPCKNGASCHDKVAGFTCTCPPNYGGEICDVWLSGCGEKDPNNPSSEELPKPCEPEHTKECIPSYDEATRNHTYKCRCMEGYAGDNCEFDTSMSFNASGPVVIDHPPENGTMPVLNYELLFWFRTTLPNVILAVGSGGTYFSLTVKDGKLNLRSSLLNNLEGIYSGSGLSNAEWHKVWISINASHIALAAGSEQTIHPVAEHDEERKDQLRPFYMTYLGGFTTDTSFLNAGKLDPYSGCIRDVQINSDPKILGKNLFNATTVTRGCNRKDQCNPDPCNKKGQCVDKWHQYKCECKRPYLGRDCQLEYRAGTFNNENSSNSAVSVTIPHDIGTKFERGLGVSMIVRTKQKSGTIFILGHENQGNFSTFLKAEITENGNLLVQGKWDSSIDSKADPYPVDSLQLSDGTDHFISIQRDKNLVTIHVNETEHFRKKVGNNVGFMPNFLFIGGEPTYPSQLKSTEQNLEVSSNEDSTSATEDLSSRNNNATSSVEDIHGQPDNNVIRPFKGIIQDFRVNGSSSSPMQGLNDYTQNHYVVEFFPLENLTSADAMGMSLGNVEVRNVLPGVHSDDTCKNNPCLNDGTCNITWNDFQCSCTKEYTGKICDKRLRCADVKCPEGTTCRNIELHGFECQAEISFDGINNTSPHYVLMPHENLTISFTEISFRFRTKQNGTVLHISHSRKKGFSFEVGFERNDTDVNETSKMGSVVVTLNGTRYENVSNNILDGEWHTFKAVISKAENLLQLKVYVDQDSDSSTPTDLILTDNSIMNITLFGNFLNDLIISNETNIVVGSRIGSVTKYDHDEQSDGQLLVHPESIHEHLYRGCLSDVRIGDLTLPVVSPNALRDANPKNTSLVEITSPVAFYIQEQTTDVPEKLHLGCVVCYDSFCSNGGACDDPEEKFECRCAPGFKGDTCDVNINECDQNECYMNQTSECVDQINKYECICKKGYEGDRCETDINECALSGMTGKTCQNGGTCIDGIGFFNCSCPPAYTGGYCQTRKKTECKDDPCNLENVERCKPLDKPAKNGVMYECVCKQGWAGEFCEKERDYCENVSCSDSGKCYSNRNTFSYECICELGFAGPLCEIDINDCASNPCENGGKCLDYINRYECDCTDTGYKGDHCDEDVDECRENIHTCESPQVCENLVGSYRCVCEDRLKCGSECDIDDPCFENGNNKTCLFGGYCESTCAGEDSKTWRCNCLKGYEGELCDVLTAARNDQPFGILLIIIPVLAALLIAATIAIVILVRMARRKRATRGVYSPSQQEYCNPRVELDNVMKPPPEERLI